jgi:hypothetical protein
MTAILILDHALSHLNITKYTAEMKKLGALLCPPVYFLNHPYKYWISAFCFANLDYHQTWTTFTYISPEYQDFAVLVYSIY